MFLDSVLHAHTIHGSQPMRLGFQSNLGWKRMKVPDAKRGQMASFKSGCTSSFQKALGGRVHLVPSPCLYPTFPLMNLVPPLVLPDVTLIDIITENVC